MTVCPSDGLVGGGDKVSITRLVFAKLVGDENDN